MLPFQWNFGQDKSESTSMTWRKKDEEGEKEERMGREEEREIKPHCKVVLHSEEATFRITLKTLCILSDGFFFH